MTVSVMRQGAMLMACNLKTYNMPKHHRLEVSQASNCKGASLLAHTSTDLFVVDIMTKGLEKFSQMKFAKMIL